MRIRHGELTKILDSFQNPNNIKRMLEKSNLILAQATGSRAPLATSRETRRQSPLPRGDAARTSRKTRPRRCLPKAVAWLRGQNPPSWVENLDFVLVRAGGLCLCSSELYSPKTFQTSSQEAFLIYSQA